MSLLHGRPACSRRHNGPPTKGARPLSLEIRPSYDRKLVAQSVHDTCFQRQGYYAQQFPEFPWQNGRTHRDSRDVLFTNVHTSTAETERRKWLYRGPIGEWMGTWRPDDNKTVLQAWIS